MVQNPSSTIRMLAYLLYLLTHVPAAPLCVVQVGNDGLEGSRRWRRSQGRFGKGGRGRWLGRGRARKATAHGGHGHVGPSGIPHLCARRALAWLLAGALQQSFKSVEE